LQPRSNGQIRGSSLAYGPGEAALSEDGTLQFSVFSEPMELRWERRRVYDHRLKLGQFTLFDGCVDAN
jgi:hypothetical protein